MNVIIGELSTGNFNFLAAGESEEHVCDILRMAWEEHVKQTGATDGWEDWQDAVNVYEIPIGGAIRDGRPII